MIEWIKQQIPEVQSIHALVKEASFRSFFRVTIGEKPYVLMVYPQVAPQEISRICQFTKAYLAVGLKVPHIHGEFSEQALLLEDLGERYLQYHFKRSNSSQKVRFAKEAIEILLAISHIPPQQGQQALDLSRQRFEMDFFISHYLPSDLEEDQREWLREQLYALTKETCRPVSFAHRDFHSRNLIYNFTQIGIVDFQDSMKAHPLYDLASFLWDAYLPWTAALRNQLIDFVSLRIPLQRRELEAVALQRTIKALGTFAYQVRVRKNLAYQRYIGRVSQSIMSNPQMPRFIPEPLQHLFGSKLSKE